MTEHKGKLRVAILFGGRSAEHEVSLVSAASVIAALDKSKYEILPVGIAPDGKWVSSPDAIDLLKEGRRMAGSGEASLLPDPRHRRLVALDARGGTPQSPEIDVVFPVLHGTFGEDGTVQGLLELANIPYVGSGVLGSAVAMDKVVAKELCKQAKIPVTPFIWFLSNSYRREGRSIVSSVEKRLRYPCFVKPANMGSSVGISKAHDRKELTKAIEFALEYDRKILIERSVEKSREIEVSVLGNDDPVASIPGEIVSSNEFYDYDAKYVDGKSESVIPAKLPKSVTRRVQELAVKSFRVTECSGMARVDFLLSKRTRAVYFNEINSIPGFTSISMYPKLWEASGLSYPELLDRLIQLALERHQAKSRLKTTYRPKSEWYR